MASATLLVLFMFLTNNFVFGNSCGGLLEGEHGYFSLPNGSNQQGHEAPNSSCLWIIQLHYETNIRFKLDALDDGSGLNLYSEDQLIVNNHTKLNAAHIGSSFDFPGKTLIVVHMNASSPFAFSWDFLSYEDKDNNSNAVAETMKNSDFVSSENGLLEWEQLETEERVTWAINPGVPVNIKWSLDIATSCNASDDCACIYFGIFQLISEGILNETVRTCGQSSEGELEGINGRVVVLIKVNTKVEANKIAFAWGVDAPAPPVSTAGLFAATTDGLISLNLQTLDATVLTSDNIGAVAVNKNLNKVYWSVITGNSSIMRSNYDGSAQEVIIPHAGGDIYMLAIDETSGNVYFGLWNAYQITVCNSLGENCAVVISNSSLANLPFGIVLDPDNGVMYWSNAATNAGSLIRANVDGSNATIISRGFPSLRGITLAEPAKDTIYYVAYTDNTIGSMDVNGGNRQTLVELERNPGPQGIQVDAQKIYFGNYLSRTIQSVDRNSSGQVLSTIFNATGPVRHLALFSAPAQQSR